MHDIPPPHELLTAEELADRLRIRPATVRAWARLGRIPRMMLSPKVVRCDYAAVVRAMAAPTRSETGHRPGWRGGGPCPVMHLNVKRRRVSRLGTAA